VPIAAVQPEVFAVVADGSTAVIYATGLGPVTNAPATGRAASAEPLSRVVAPVEVKIAGTSVPVTFAGLAPGYAGLYQINAQIPQSVPAGAELTISVSGATSKPVAIQVPVPR
jgi:uncharacterized protein (TIGR03437 family)